MGFGLSYKEIADSENLPDGTYIYYTLATITSAGMMDGLQVKNQQENPQRGKEWIFTVFYDEGLKQRVSLFDRRN